MSRPSQTAGEGYVTTVVFGVVVGGGGLVAALAWLVVQPWALFRTGQPARVGTADLADVVLQLAAAPGDPAAAYPDTIAAAVPGPLGYWTTVGVTVSVVMILAAVVMTHRRRRDHRPTDHSAEWATARELRPLLVDAPERGRLVLGRHGSRLVAAEAGQAVIVFGPARSGKTTGLAIPAILEWKGPVIATSVRTDLVDATHTRRAAKGRAWVYDPTAEDDGGWPRAGWDPLEGCSEWQTAQRTAGWLCDAGKPNAGIGDEDFWSAVAAKLLAPLLYAAARGGYQMRDVVRWVDTQEELEVLSELETSGEAEPLAAAFASWSREERARSSAYTTLEVILRAFADPQVAASCRPDIDIDTLVGGGAHTLYVCAPSQEHDRLRPLFTALLQRIITAAYTQASRHPGSDARLLIVLDEAANIAPLRNLDTIASTAAGSGIQLVTVWQDLAQIQARYGRRAATVVNNHRAKLVLSGVSDEPTLTHVSRLLGHRELTKSSTSTDGAGRRSTTDAPTWRPLAPAEALRAIAPGEAVCVYGHLPPARLHLRPWYDDRRLSRLAGSRPADNGLSSPAGTREPV